MSGEYIDKILSSFLIKAESKKDENMEEAHLRRFKDKILFLFTLSFITAVFIICTIIIFKYNSFSAIALNGAIGLALGVAGYYARGKTIC